MLKNYITLLLLAFAGFSLNAQCPPGDVTLSSQAQVDSFVATYPNCTEITGSMLIGSLFDTTDITNISGLNSLTSIGGDLLVLKNPVLTSLMGLEQLTSFKYSQNKTNQGRGKQIVCDAFTEIAHVLREFWALASHWC